MISISTRQPIVKLHCFNTDLKKHPSYQAVVVTEVLVDLFPTLRSGWLDFLKCEHKSSEKRRPRPNVNLHDKLMDANQSWFCTSNFWIQSTLITLHLSVCTMDIMMQVLIRCSHLSERYIVSTSHELMWSSPPAITSCSLSQLATAFVHAYTLCTAQIPTYEFPSQCYSKTMTCVHHKTLSLVSHFSRSISSQFSSDTRVNNLESWL